MKGPLVPPAVLILGLVWSAQPIEAQVVARPADSTAGLPDCMARPTAPSGWHA